MYRKALFSLTVLFFMMGFITCLNDILVPYMKSVFNLTYGQASLVQFCFFAAYGLTSIPASKLIQKVGYQTGMVIGFATTAFGCILFYPAVSFNTYDLFLFALFVLASGVVMLQVAANPYVSVLGPENTASSRLTMTQAFNSFGTFVAPFFGSFFILRHLENSTTPEGVKYPYLFIAGVLIVIAIFLSRMKLPVIEDEKNEHAHSSWKQVLKEPNLILGMLGIFSYVGAEVAIGSFLVNYIIEITPMAETEAANLIAFYWGGAMAGRFLGIYTLKMFKPGRVLALHSIAAIALILLSVNTTGDMAVYSMIMVGFCNSIMFPTIFTLGIKGLEKAAHKASGLLATAILGGAFIPLFTGQLADAYGLKMAFLLPVVCYAYISFFGLRSK